MPDSLNQDTRKVLLDSIAKLSKPIPGLETRQSAQTDELPSVHALSELMTLIRNVIFPGFFSDCQFCRILPQNSIGVNTERIFSILHDEIYKAVNLMLHPVHPATHALLKARSFVEKLPQIRDILMTDVDAMFTNDPAATGRPEVVFCYPAVTAMLHYRVANALLTDDVPLLPRIIAEMAHSATGIDIHPGATIGSHFSIDHGTGVVIGETCIIGHHVSIYQGVTLGAKNFTLDSNGHPMNIPRHPIIQDNVTIYSNATILGRVTIGHGSIIGGNVWLTHSLPPNSRLLQRRPYETTFTDGAGI